MMELPYPLIDLRMGDEHFVFQCTALGNQTAREIEAGGVSCEFGIQYQCSGMGCAFRCDITVGNVYEFYLSLDTAYDILFGRNASAVLKNYGDILNRTKLTVTFDKRGHCRMKGHFQNADNHYQSGINISFEIDQSYISDMVCAMTRFFEELASIQGNWIFY